MRPGPVRRAAWALAVVSGLAGAILWVVPPSATVAALAPVPADTTSLPIAVTDPAIAEDIAVANVFARSRTAPSTRYTPGDVADEANGAMLPEDASFDAADVEMGGPRLLGTVVSPDGPRALLQLDPASASRLYAVGDVDAGYRIMSITPRVVVLRNAGGRVTLRLDPEEVRP